MDILDCFADLLPPKPGIVLLKDILVCQVLIIAEDFVNLRIDREDTVGVYIENIMPSTGFEAFDKRTL